MLLRRTKRFAEALAACGDATVPREIAGILDTLSIVVAITRCRCRISSLGDHEMQRQIESSLAEPWLDEPTRVLLRNGRDAIASGGADLISAVETPPGTSFGLRNPAGPPGGISTAGATWRRRHGNGLQGRPLPNWIASWPSRSFAAVRGRRTGPMPVSAARSRRSAGSTIPTSSGPTTPEHRRHPFPGDGVCRRA